MSESSQSNKYPNYPNPPHPHAELIKAWADGALIEVYDSTNSEWLNINNPNWDVHTQYRIKPTPAPKKYFRVFEVTWPNGRKSLDACSTDYPDLDRIFTMSNVRSISDWTEYE